MGETTSARRVALVTGGGRGIGRAIALGLAADGMDVAISYRRDAESAAATVAEVAEAGRRSAARQGSVDRLEDDRGLVEWVIEYFGRLDVLVVNAGIASRGHSVLHTEPDELDRVMRTHAYGAHHLCQAAIPALRDQDRSDIVLVSSVATLTDPANGAPYNMAKAALESLGRTLAKEELRNGVRVNIVAPGLVDTTMGQKLMRAVAGVEDLRALDSSMPFGHVCTPDDVAHVVRWLVGPDNTYVTGQKINVDGLATFLR